MNGGDVGSSALLRALALTLLLAGPASAQQAADTVAPEAKTAIESKPAVTLSWKACSKKNRHASSPTIFIFILTASTWR